MSIKLLKVKFYVNIVKEIITLMVLVNVLSVILLMDVSNVIIWLPINVYFVKQNTISKQNLVLVL